MGASEPADPARKSIFSPISDANPLIVHRDLAMVRAQARGRTMIKSELIAKLAAENPHLTQKDVERVVGVILDSMTGALEKGGRVELRGFGAFSMKRREARRGRNPRTGAAVAVSEKAIPVVKTGKEMRQRLNAAGIGESASAAE